jgi:hypothetical protein
MFAAELFAAYRWQPNLEKRHAQHKARNPRLLLKPRVKRVLWDTQMARELRAAHEPVQRSLGELAGEFGVSQE